MSAITEWAGRVLETDEDILVPVKKLWNEYTAQVPGTTLAEFTRELENDARFEFFAGTNREKEMREMGLSEEEMREEEAEMEAAGFFHGPRVKLKRRAITPDHIAAMIKKHTDRMMSALWAAYDVRPEDLDEEGEQELLDIIARAKELQLKAQEATQPSKDENKKSE